MNYFLENHVGELLKGPMNCVNKRAVRAEIENNLEQLSSKKYINLLAAFEDKIIELGVGPKYEEMLLNLIEEEKTQK